MRTRHLLILPLALFSLGCLEGSTGPGDEQPPEIRLRVTGGLAGVDFSVLVDGPQGEVIGESCVSGCDFEDGRILHGLSQDQTAYLAGLFREAGIHGLKGTDFGTECCDQFHYALEYLDEKGKSTVQGSSEVLPPDLREAVGAVAGFAWEVVPIIVAPDAEMENWQGGLAMVLEVAVRGDYLDVEFAHEMGCGPHHLDLVAYGGWMESYPVQIRAFFTTAGTGEFCDTPFVTRKVTFDLRPLKKAYQWSYGMAEQGGTTVALLISGAPAFSSLMWNRFDYVF